MQVSVITHSALSKRVLKVARIGSLLGIGGFISHANLLPNKQLAVLRNSDRRCPQESRSPSIDRAVFRPGRCEYGPWPSVSDSRISACMWP